MPRYLRRTLLFVHRGPSPCSRRVTAAAAPWRGCWRWNHNMRWRRWRRRRRSGSCTLVPGLEPVPLWKALTSSAVAPGLRSLDRSAAALRPSGRPRAGWPCDPCCEHPDSLPGPSSIHPASPGTPGPSESGPESRPRHPPILAPRQAPAARRARRKAWRRTLASSYSCSGTCTSPTARASSRKSSRPCSRPRSMCST